MVAFLLPLKVHYSNIAIGVAVFFWLVTFSKERLKQDTATLTVFCIFCSLYLIEILGLVHSDNLRYGFFLLETKLALLIFPVIIFLSSITQKHVTYVLRAFMAGVTAASLICMVLAIQKLLEIKVPLSWFFTDDRFHNQKFTEPISIHPAYLSFCISILIFYIIEREWKHRKLRPVWVGLLLFFGLCLFILMSRAAIAAFALALLVYVVYEILHRKQFLVTGLTLLAIFFLTVFITLSYVPDFRARMLELTENYEVILKSDNGSSTSLHVQQWYCAWNSVNGIQLIWGLGTGDEKDALTECYTENQFKWLIKLKLDAHNEYLSSLVRHGIIGVILLFLNLVVAIVLALKSRSPLYLTFIVMVIIHAISVSILYGQVSLIIYSLFNTLFAKEALLQQNVSWQFPYFRRKSSTQ
jgi:O-antigen ligase